MSLSSVMQTALSGINAAETAAAAVANNVANSRTNGFKSSRPTFASQTPQTRSSGAPPTARSGGANPVQVGTGVQLADGGVDFSQGTVARDSSPTSLALQGDGLFILEGDGGERLFTRNGKFKFNASSELVTSQGRRVLGFRVDNNFALQTSQLSPLRIRLGAVAQSANGSAAHLQGFSITGNGRIRGRFSDGVVRDLGQIRLARFANPSGLAQRGDGTFAAGPNSGPPVEVSPGDGAATVEAGAVELSNVDIGESMIDLIELETQFRANLAVLSTADSLLDELIGLPRVS